MNFLDIWDIQNWEIQQYIGLEIYVFNNLGYSYLSKLH